MGEETDIQSDIMIALGDHPLVVWSMVVTTGNFRIRGGFIRTGHYMIGHQKQQTGMSDVVGQLTTGQFFSIEVKKPKEKPTSEQLTFIDTVVNNGGVSGWADNVNDAIKIIEND